MASFDLSPAASEVVRSYAKDRGCTNDEAAEALVTIGVNRVNALRTYAEKTPKAAKKAKAPKAKKASKGKGPIARKAKKAKAESPAQEAAAAS